MKKQARRAGNRIGNSNTTVQIPNDSHSFAEQKYQVKPETTMTTTVEPTRLSDNGNRELDNMSPIPLEKNGPDASERYGEQSLLEMSMYLSVRIFRFQVEAMHV